MTGAELPWGQERGARPGRGPKPALSLPKIVRAAIEVADTEGLDALSMQRVAAALGFTTMSLYRYVPSKDLLVEVMLDTACGLPPESGEPGGAGGEGDWRAELRAWATGLWEVYRRHPWAVRVQISGPPAGPNQLAWFEAALRPLSRLGLGPGEMISTAMFLGAAIRGLSQVSTGLAASTAPGASPRGYDQLLRTLADPARFPTLAAMVDADTFDPGEVSIEEFQDVAPDLEFGVERLLDGLERYAREPR